MGEDTEISWIDDTFNPWWGCEKVSPACAHCYAETFAERFPASRGLWGKGSARRFQSDKYWAVPLKWDRQAFAAGERRRVFCASMADVFEDRDELVPHRARLFDLIRRTPNLDWLLLTKRPENVMRHLTEVKHRTECTTGTVDFIAWLGRWLDGVPPANVWLGTTVENQEMADQRIPELLSIHAKVRFLSCEPLLGPVEFSDVSRRKDCVSQLGKPALDGIHWVICGGESGPHARPMHPDWARSLRDQCAAARVPFHFKQWGEWARYIGISAWDDDGKYLPKGKATADYREYVLEGDVTIRGIFQNHSTQNDTIRVGTARAGRLLDGQLHDAFPTL